MRRTQTKRHWDLEKVRLIEFGSGELNPIFAFHSKMEMRLMPEENWLTDCVFTVDRFFTPNECDKYIQISEDFGYEDALVNTPEGPSSQGRRSK